MWRAGDRRVGPFVQQGHISSHSGGWSGGIHIARAKVPLLHSHQTVSSRQAFVGVLHTVCVPLNAVCSGGLDCMMVRWDFSSGKRLQQWDMGTHGLLARNSLPALCAIDTTAGSCMSLQCDRHLMMADVQGWTWCKMATRCSIPHT